MYYSRKEEDKTLVINYRSICKLNAFSKLFEILVNSALFPSINGIRKQGIFPHRSVEGNLIKYTD